MALIVLAGLLIGASRWLMESKAPPARSPVTTVQDAAARMFTKPADFCALMRKLGAGGMLNDLLGIRYDRARLGTGSTAGLGGAVRVHYLCLKPDRTVLADTRRDGHPVVWSSRQQPPSIGLLLILSDMRTGDQWRIATPPDRAFSVDKATGKVSAVPPEAIGQPLAVDEVRLYEIDVLEVIHGDEQARIASTTDPPDVSSADVGGAQ